MVRRLIALLLAGGMAGCSSAQATESPSTATTDSPPPAVAVDHPAVRITAASHLHDGETVLAEVTGFGVGGKVFLSECSSAALATDLGCGAELARQTLLVTDDSRAGHASFEASIDAPSGPLPRGRTRCSGQCVIVATVGGGLPFVSAPSAFDAP